MRRFTLCILALILLLALPAGAEGAYIGSHPAEDIFQVQTSRHTCTLIACTMMLRCRLSLAGKPYGDVTESVVARSGWIRGVGLKHSFSVGELDVAMSPEIARCGDKAACLVACLSEHPEGVVIYDADLPHALWLYGYDADTDTFHCADTQGSLGGRGITLAESSLRGADQAARVQSIDRIWYVSGN